MQEPIENRRKRLIFRSWHRGTREMDLIMGSFADRHVPGFDSAQLDQYEALLIENDPDLYNWFSGQETPPQGAHAAILPLFLAHKVAS